MTVTTVNRCDDHPQDDEGHSGPHSDAIVGSCTYNLSDNAFFFVTGGGDRSPDESSTTTSANIPAASNSIDRGDGPPIGLHDQYRTLRTALAQSLTGKSNAVALLVGPHGHGKRTVLERCLTSLFKERQRLFAGVDGKVGEATTDAEEADPAAAAAVGTSTGPTGTSTISNEAASAGPHSRNDRMKFFRVVRISGLMLRGDDTAAAREMVRQLSANAVEEGRRRTRAGTTTTPSNGDGVDRASISLGAERKGGSVGGMERTVGASMSSSSAPPYTAAEVGGTVGEPEMPSSSLSESKNNCSDVTSSNASVLKSQPSTTAGPDPQPATKKSKKTKYQPHKGSGLVSATSSFHSNLALLDESLRRARIDGEPILIIIRDVDAFASTGGGGHPGGGGSAAAAAGTTRNPFAGGGAAANPGGGRGGGTSNKQILLYHLLDRAASENVHLVVVGMTSRLTLDDMLEKRILSRAKGTQVIIKFHRYDYDDLVNVLCSKLVDDDLGGVGREHSGAGETRKDGDDDDNNGGSSLQKSQQQQRLKLQLQEMLRSRGDVISTIFRRCHALGRDVRWFSRVLTVALATMARGNDEEADQQIRLRQHLLDGLVAMGCDLTEATKAGYFPSLWPEGEGRTNSSSGGGVSTALSTAPSSSGHMPTSRAAIDTNNPRVRALLDLPGSQLAILLSAKRIVSKDESAKGDDVAEATSVGGYVRPITFDRIYVEYDTTFARRHADTFSADRYSKHVLFQAFLHLMECDLIRPAGDHAGSGSLQYEYRNRWLCTEDVNGMMVNVAIHVALDLEGELHVALQKNLLDCSTALRDWGLKQFR